MVITYFTTALKECDMERHSGKSPDYQSSFTGSSWNSARRTADMDVTFHVGREGDLWKIPARKEILAKSNPVFSAMFLGPWSQLTDNIVIVTDVDGRGFENLVNYLCGEKIELRSVATAVATLHAAQKYLCTALTELCVSYLSEQINSSNVLHVLQHALFYAVSLPCLEQPDNYSPSAPPELELVSTQETVESTGSAPVISDQDGNNWCTSLVQKCLHYIDKTGTTVLGSEDFEDLDREALKLIVGRDTLSIVYESEVLDALCRWAQCECRRRQLDLSTANRRNVLGDLLWKVRFLAMPPEEFLIGPVASGLLTAEEQVAFIGCHKGQRKHTDLPSYIQAHIPSIATKRSPIAARNTVVLASDCSTERKAKKANSCAKDVLSSCRNRVDRANVTEKIFVCLACIFE